MSTFLQLQNKPPKRCFMHLKNHLFSDLWLSAMYDIYLFVDCRTFLYSFCWQIDNVQGREPSWLSRADPFPPLRYSCQLRSIHRNTQCISSAAGTFESGIWRRSRRFGAQVRRRATCRRRSTTRSTRSSRGRPAPWTSRSRQTALCSPSRTSIHTILSFEYSSCFQSSLCQCT